jgi:DNA mismatch endonuclease (patch repair protein)
LIDVVSQKVRSLMMSGIKGKNTKPEVFVRKALFAKGYRFRLHRKDLPGSPDVVLSSRKLVIFVNGCFWHCHTGCSLAKMPATRSEFWRAKLEGNRIRDLEVIGNLKKLGWRVLVVWECFIRQQPNHFELGSALAKWIESEQVFGEFSG